MTKYHRKSSRLSQPFLDFFTFEIAAVNAFILYRGQNPSYKKGIRAFAEQVIEESVQNLVNLDERCWIMRQYTKGNIVQRSRLRERFTRKHVSRLSKLQLRNEMGPVAPDPEVDYSVALRNDKLKRKRAHECMDFVPTKVGREQKRKCFVCGRTTLFYCAGGRCQTWACFYGRGLYGNPFDTCLGKLHKRLIRARKKLRRGY